MATESIYHQNVAVPPKSSVSSKFRGAFPLLTTTVLKMLVMSKTNDICRNHRTTWSLDEIRYLERYYGHKSAKIIGETLGRTTVAVRLEARKLGITTLMVPWSEEEKEIIRIHYARGEGITRLCELLPDRNRKSIFQMALKMRISSQRNWSDEEIRVLEQYYPAIGVEAASKIPGRTKDAIKHKAYTLKIRYLGGEENNARQKIWSEQETLRLKYYQYLPLPELMKYFPNRSRLSVKTARERLRKLL